MQIFGRSVLVRRNPDDVLDAALAALPEAAFRLRARDAAIVLANGWRARFAWEGERDKAWASEADSLVITLHGVDVLRVVDLRRRAPYPEQWTVSKRPTTRALILGAADALNRLAACTLNPPPGFVPAFERPEWDAFE